MLKSMGLELSQADLKAIGRSRGFEPETIASRALLQHVFLSEKGLASAMALLSPVEVAGLHLLHCGRDQVDLEFFKSIYPAVVSPHNLYASYNDRFKTLFQHVRTQLVQRGLLLMGTLPDTSFLRGTTILERRRFRFPQAFGAWLPALFPAGPLDPARTGHHRREILRDKVMEILKLESAGKSARGESGRWRLEEGELRFGPGSSGFRREQLERWQRSQFEAAVGYTSKTQPEAFRPVPLLDYALSRLREHEWLAPNDLLPWWKLALPTAKAPEPLTVCEAGYAWGCVEKIELDGSPRYRLPPGADSEASAPPEAFLEVGHPQQVCLRLERTPVAALERLAEIARLALVEARLWASPSLLKLSHARAETLADPLVRWLHEHHPAFRATGQQLEQRRGKLILHENLLVARVSDLALKVMLEKKFGEPGQLVSLSGEFVAFPIGLLPALQSWMKKSGHVIKTIPSGEPVSAAEEEEEEEPADE